MNLIVDDSVMANQQYLSIRNNQACFFIVLGKKWLRIQEYEADRFAVLNMRMPIDDQVKSLGKHADHHERTFQATHPRLEQSWWNKK